MLHCCLSVMSLKSGLPGTECRNNCTQAQLAVVCRTVADCPAVSYGKAHACRIEPRGSPTHKVCIYPGDG